MRISDWSSDVCSSELLRPLPERVPSRVPPHIGAHGIIHARALERGVAERKTAGFDDMRRRAETGGGAQDRANIAGDVGLEHGDFHCASRSEEHTSELQSLMRISYAVFCLKKNPL